MNTVLLVPASSTTPWSLLSATILRRNCSIPLSENYSWSVALLHPPDLWPAYVLQLMPRSVQQQMNTVSSRKGQKQIDSKRTRNATREPSMSIPTLPPCCGRYCGERLICGEERRAEIERVVGHEIGHKLVVQTILILQLNELLSSIIAAR